jgi:uncharacterized membrane protein YoaK (UPF0700 family)
MSEGGRRPGRDEAIVGLLAFGAGAMDALSFVALGEVFTAAMTGNAVLLGIAIGERHLAAAARSVAALLGFLAGAAIACRTLIGAPRGAFSRGVATGFAIEAGLLTAFALLLAALGHAGSALPITLILLAAAGMGAQSAVARHLDFPGILTTVFTGTLVDIAAALTGLAAPRGTPRSTPHMPWRTAREIAAFAIYIAGAAAGGFLALRHAWLAGLVPLAAILATLALGRRFL